MAIVQFFEQPVHVKPVYLTAQSRSYWRLTFPTEHVMSKATPEATYSLAGHTVRRMGYGAMQLAGPGVFGPPKDRNEAIAVLREAVDSGVNHIDTSDFYGPHVTNQIIREALYPYPDNLVIVTKVGAVRGEDASWLSAMEPQDIERGVHDNLRNLGLDAIEVVNLRIMGKVHAPAEGTIARQVETLAELQRKGLVRHIGLSNATSTQVAEAQGIVDIVCVQNQYNLVLREDDALVDELAAKGIAYVPFFPLGGFTPLQSSVLTGVAERLGATPMQVALAWLLHRSPNILLIPGTSSRGHLRENMQAAQLDLSDAVLEELGEIGQAA
jgi:aryl-alcohol dehydrogenase-like predicted oxidoreductase